MDQEKIGKFIAELRKAKKMTQEELATKLNVNSRSVSRWENGKGLPDLSLLAPLGKELGVSVNDLLNGKKTDKKDYQETFEFNMMNVVSNARKDKKKRNYKRILKAFLIIFVIIPLIILCLGQIHFTNAPSFSSIPIMHKANQFYKALQETDIDALNELMTDDPHNEMCWVEGYTKNNFLEGIKELKKFKYKVEYTSFRATDFYYFVPVEGDSWEYEYSDEGEIVLSSCSPSSNYEFAVVYELCFKDRTEKACVTLTFSLDDEKKLTYMVDSKDINLSENAFYRKYRPIYYPASANSAIYNSLHYLVTDVFRGQEFKTITEDLEYWLENYVRYD